MGCRLLRFHAEPARGLGQGTAMLEMVRSDKEVRLSGLQRIECDTSR